MGGVGQYVCGGADAPVPPCPVPGHRWGQIVHNNQVQWLAMFPDTINQETKYVFFSNSSSFKGRSDWRKFETARQLKVPLYLCVCVGVRLDNSIDCNSIVERGKFD